jgi:hypothetical protein
MLLQQWIILFSTACFGNVLGLNISAGMRTAVSIYILIPLILVPQLLLGGAMIKFDDLHKTISKKIYVPVIGDVMVTRWAYEALCVEQFKSNKFEKPFFNYDMEISQDDWYVSFLIPTLKVRIDNLITSNKDPDYKDSAEEDLEKISYHINDLSAKSGIKPAKWVSNLNYQRFDSNVGGEAKLFLDSLRTIFRLRSKSVSNSRDSLVKQISGRMGNDQFINMRSKDYNENLANIVLNRLSTNKIFETDDKFIQKADPVFMPPGSKYGRAHFFAPYKQIGNIKIETLVFNIIIIWVMVTLFFVTLYYNLLKRLIRFLESLNLPILRKFGRDLLQF